MSNPPTASTLIATNLRKSFHIGRRQPAITAVDDVSFTIGHGESLGLVGESGSGKSTIARIVAGLERPDSGTLSVDGHDRLSTAPGKTRRLRRAREVQMVFQDPYGSLDRRLTVQQCLEHAITLHSGSISGTEKRSRVAELLDQVRLAGTHAASKPHQLSGGQRQRVAIARALAVLPSVVILDEAVSALDVSVQDQILALLDEIRQQSGVGLLFVSHDLAVVAEVTQRVLVLYKGAIVEEGATAEVLQAPQHPYTRLLVSSTPGEGWDPAAVVEQRRRFNAERHNATTGSSEPSTRAVTLT
ncbi:ATP-binding cassette domain-containing protein [Rhodococcus sp. MS13]|uniref:ABC transporter ATP-binding protein n=1 Tax=Rhodococcus sp. MS13 TaxID=2579940 RepID=UPI001561DBD0|nr:ATP-binding cassette domain-containing protein [Rhodococcus sp. MS13]NRH30211.1 ABC transporter ATP-binding protein [Rhodococcus sp. MS13]